MAVTRVDGASEPVKKSAKKKTKKKERRRITPAWLPSMIQLPKMPKKPITDMRAYSFMLYGTQGIGKTTALSSFPGMLFCTAEAGGKGLEIMEWNEEHGGTSSWPIFLAAVTMLEKDPGDFKNIAVDTVDRLYQMCQDYMCDEVLHIPGPGLDSDGVNDRGISYKAINREFSDTLDRIVRSGIGLWLTSHVKEVTIKKRGGGEYDKLCCSMSDSPRRIVESYVDFIFFADHAKDGNSEDCRIVVTQGDELITAKSRPVAGRSMPKYLPMLKSKWYDMLKETFDGSRRYRLDPKTLLPSKKSTKSAAESISDDRVKSRLRKNRKGG